MSDVESWQLPYMSTGGPITASQAVIRKIKLKHTQDASMAYNFRQYSTYYWLPDAVHLKSHHRDIIDNMHN